MSDEDDIPDVQICQERVEKFAEITGTDEACAQFYLQDRKWDLERSVNAFFEAKQSSGINVMNDNDAEVPEIVVNLNKAVVDQLSLMPAVSLPPVRPVVRPISHRDLEPSIKPPSNFTFITWNIDGLNQHNLKRRTKAVCHLIFQNTPDVVFLQEVIPTTFSYIESQLPEYHCIAGGESEYFTATLLRRFTTYYDSHRVIPFAGTSMGRNLLATQAHIGRLKLSLLNSHLESTADFAAERVRQLELAFQEVKAAPSNHTVILAGDLNLRDKEVDLCGGLPNNVIDLWVAGGSRPECRYTWDMTRNTNTEFAGRFKPRCRFDRAYLRPACPPNLRPKFFGLIGLQKVAGTESFPSDHWGILCHFDILDQGDQGTSSPLKKRKLDESGVLS